MYDYLIVGAGLSGAIFAHEATKRGKKVKVLTSVVTSVEISTVKILKELMFTSTVPIFSILPTKRFGTMSTSSLNSTTISTHQWLTTREASTIFLST